MRHAIATVGASLAFLCQLGAMACAEEFDGVYLGRTKLVSASYPPDGTRSTSVCRAASDYKITIAGATIKAENLSAGSSIVGTVESGGNFRIEGNLGYVASVIEGR